MSYEVSITRKATKAIARLPDTVYQRVKDAIADLANEPRPSGCKKLRGYKDSYRIWVGRDYRVLYRVDDQEQRIEVFWVGSRQDAY